MTNHKLKEIIYRNLMLIALECDPTEKLLPNDNVHETLDIDSYGFLQRLVCLSEKTGVEIHETDDAQVFTLERMLGCLSSHLS